MDPVKGTGICISMLRTLIPWCFAYDKVNYARYLTVYYAEMLALPESKPEVYQEFIKHLMLDSFQFNYLVSTLFDEYQLIKLLR